MTMTFASLISYVVEFIFLVVNVVVFSTTKDLLNVHVYNSLYLVLAIKKMKWQKHDYAQNNKQEHSTDCWSFFTKFFSIGIFYFTKARSTEHSINVNKYNTATSVVKMHVVVQKKLRQPILRTNCMAASYGQHYWFSTFSSASISVGNSSIDDHFHCCRLVNS